MKYIQAVLQRENTKLVSWLPADSRLKVGVEVELKGEEGFWKISACGEPMEMPESAKHNSEKWHENDSRRKIVSNFHDI